MRISLLRLAGIIPTLLLRASPSAAQSPTAAASWTIPGIANVAGQNGTHFVSDVAVTNPSSTPTAAFATFVGSGGGAGNPVILAAGQTVVWRNVLQQLWGLANTSGALSITSDRSLIIRARTYNDAAGGTYGVALPVYGAEDVLQPGRAGHSLWVSQSADATRGYRTNIAVLLPNSDGGTATVTIYDADGNKAGQTDFSLDTAGVLQIGVGKFSSPVDVGRAEIDVKRGIAAGYSVVVDNVTGDSSLFPFEPLPAGIQDVLVNGVARANGKNGTFYRTDGRFFNPGSADATVTVAYHASQSSNPSPASGSFTVPAGKILDVTDVLGTFLGLPVGSSGALRFQSDSAVGILCRTSNVDPTGAKPGTFGAQQKPVPLLSFLSSADAGALVTGIRQNASYRTNVGFAAGPDGATYQLTLKSAPGGTVATATRSLGAFGWEQPGIGTLFGSVPDDAQLLVKVTQGSLDVYDSSVDNGSGDSVVTPAQQLPVAIPSSVTIGPDGGSVRSADGSLTLKVPAGALASPTTVSLAPESGVPGANGSTTPYRILPDGLSFARPALLVWNYAAADLAGTSEGALSLAVSDGSAWYILSGGSLDISRRTVTVPLDTLTPPAASRQPTLSGPGFVVDRSWGWQLNPTVAVRVEGSTKPVTFSVTVYSNLPSTAVGRGTPPGRVAPHTVTDVQWYVDGNDAGRSSSISVAIPDCSPPGGSYPIIAMPFLPSETTLPGTLFVFPRDWTVEIRQFVYIQQCQAPVPKNVPTFKSGTVLRQNFEFNDDLSIRLDPLVSASVLRQDPILCPYTGTDCHFTQISMGSIDPGGIQSISLVPAPSGIRSVWPFIRVVFTNMALPSLTWSSPNKTTCPTSSKFDGFPSSIRTETWAVPPDGASPAPAEAPFTGIQGVVSTQSFQYSIRPISSSTCPR